MTYEEAIKTIQIAKAEVEWNYPMDYAIAFEKAIEALEKQIPKKPELYDNNYFCTECDAHLFIFADSYCSGCGQAIDWSKEYD